MTRIHDKSIQLRNSRLSAKAKKLFIEKLDKVFDIVVCQCPIELCSKSDCNPAHCSNGFHISCSCERDFKIPTMELRYLLDQREKVGQRGGSMQMTKVDKAEV